MTREEVVKEALTWEGTPYHHHGRVKGVGVDCAQLPAAVYEAVGLIPHVNPKYSEQWMMSRDEELYLSYVFPHAREITRDQIRAGDFVIWRWGRTFSHGAIVIEPPMVLHAVISAGSVVRANMDEEEELRRRPARFFTVFED